MGVCEGAANCHADYGNSGDGEWHDTSTHYYYYYHGVVPWYDQEDRREGVFLFFAYDGYDDSDEDEGDEREMLFGERRLPTVTRTGGGSHGVGGGCAPRYVDAAVMQRMAELTQETIQLRGEVARLREEHHLQG